MKKIQLGHHVRGKKYKHPKMWAIVDDANKFDAARAYNKYAKEVFGEHALLNSLNRESG